jgi:hypothetical protein
MSRLAVAVLCALALAPAADAARSHPPTHLSPSRATQVFLAKAKVADWVGRYQRKSLVTQAIYQGDTRTWIVNVWSGAAGEIATGRVDDYTGAVLDAFTGPQVAWTMARGSPGAFGGRRVNSTWLWLLLSSVFFFGLADLRRPLSLRNLDLLVLLSFAVSLWYFNHGRVFSSVSFAYPPLIYLLARMVFVGIRNRNGREVRPLLPVWLLAGVAIFLLGFRIGLDVVDSNVIDVGYSGVIGAERIASGQAPYGHFPIEGNLPKCGPADAFGEVRDRIQANGHCESSNPQGDTYGPVAYEAYLPGYAIFGWDGKWPGKLGWDSLPAVHFTALLFDTLCAAGLLLVGRRFGGYRLGVTLAFAWLAYPFTLYTLSSNTNDAIMPAFLIWGFWLVTAPAARGALLALAGWTKFAAILLVPLWLFYPDGLRSRGKLRFLLGFLAATIASFSILLLEPSLGRALRVFWDRTVLNQFHRTSPFSLWDWRQYHAGLPDLHVQQRILEVLLAIGAGVVGFVPRRKSLLQLAALTGALLIGFEIVLTHWFYLYLPWFFPFVALALMLPRPASEEEALFDEQPAPELVAAG